MVGKTMKQTWVQLWSMGPYFAGDIPGNIGLIYIGLKYGRYLQSIGSWNGH